MKNVLNIKLFCLLAIMLCWSMTSPAKATACVSFSGNGVNNWYPFSYRTENGELTGIVVDSMREALKRLGLKLDIQDDRPWKRILYDIENDRLDMVLGAYWNSERAQKYFYTDELAKDELRVFVKKGNEFPFTSFEDLIGRSGMHLLGGSLGDEFDRFSKKHLDFRGVPQSDIIVKMLDIGRADYGILGYIEGLKFIHTMNLTGEIVALAKPILSNNMHVMIRKKATCAHRVDDINKAIEAMKKDGTLQHISSDHLKRIANY